jgi:hypothetical protein
MEGIAPLGTLDPQHAIAQLVKALAYPARAFASVRLRNGSSASWFSVRGTQIIRVERIEVSDTAQAIIGNISPRELK